MVDDEAEERSGQPLPPNAALKRLRRLNRRSLRTISAFRDERERDAEAFAEFSRLKHRHPYYGFVPCTSEGLDVVMFHASDDVVAWEYLWFGADSYETPIVRTWVRWARVSETVYDIGAYTGLMTLLAAAANPRATVHLFEPMDRTVERAKINVRANGYADRVTLHAQAASDEAGPVEINLYRDEDFLGTGNSIFDKSLDIAAVKTIRSVRVDDELPDLAPDLVKVDVEGHELATLRGLAASVERGRPRMVVESWDHSRKDLLVLLEGWGYRCEPFEDVDQRVMNFRCVPVEKPEPADPAQAELAVRGRFARRPRD